MNAPQSVAGVHRCDLWPAGLGFPCLVVAEAAVMAGPGDEMAPRAVDDGHLRASDFDRAQVIDDLKAAYVDGLVTKDEFDTRVSQTLA